MNIIKIQSLLEKIESLLTQYKVNYATCLGDIRKHFELVDPLGDRQEILTDDIRRHLLGGMGSLNDVWISKDNEHDIEVEDEQAANQKLDELREQLRALLIEE